MKLRQNIQLIEGPINIIPFVNILFLLLIFFALTSNFVFQPGVKIDLPQGGMFGTFNLRHMITVTGHQPPLFFFNDQIVTRDMLNKKLQQIAAQEPGTTIILKADSQTPYALTMDLTQQILKCGLSVSLATDNHENPRSSF
jgi:biopolymer transport protein ExbD